jgi:hypothetical protein
MGRRFLLMLVIQAPLLLWVFSLSARSQKV